MKLLRQQIRQLILEAISVDVAVGDVILTGKYKNKRKIVKTIGTDELGQPTVNGKSILKFKIEKHLPKNKWSAKSREELKESNILAEASDEEISTALEQIDEFLATGALADAIYFYEIYDEIPTEQINWKLAIDGINENTSMEAVRSMLQVIVENPEVFGSDRRYSATLETITVTINSERELVDAGNEKKYRVWSNQVRRRAIGHIKQALKFM